MEKLNMTVPFTETQTMIRDSIRSAFESELAPLVHAIEAGEQSPVEPLRRVMTDLGVLGAGGLNDYVTNASEEDRLQQFIPRMLMIELSRLCVGMAVTWTVTRDLVGQTILSQGTAEQREKYGVPLRDFEIMGSWGLTEYTAGSAVFRDMKSTAKSDGDYYVLNGSKSFISNAPIADVFIIWALLEVDGRPTPRSFIVEAADEGITVGKPLVKMGMKSSLTAEVYLSDCRIPKDRLLDPSSRAREKISANESGRKNNFVSKERFGMQVMSYGIMERAFEIALKYARDRIVGGRAIGEYQLIQRRLARMYMALNNSHMLVWADVLAQQSHPFNTADNSVGKLYVSESGTMMTNEAIHILGGFGYLQEAEVERLYRDVKLIEIGSGTTEIQEITAGKWLLDNYQI